MAAFRMDANTSGLGEEDDLFSKPVVRKRYDRTKAAEAVTAAEEALPFVSTSNGADEMQVPQHDSPKEVFSPPLSLPESTSSADGNLDQDAVSPTSSYEEEDTILKSTEYATSLTVVPNKKSESQSSTSSINRLLKDNSIAPRAKEKKPYSTIGSSDAQSAAPSSTSNPYDFDAEMDADASPPQEKKGKQEPSDVMKEIREARQKYGSSKGQRMVYTHTWRIGNEDEDESDDEQERANSERRTREQQRPQPQLKVRSSQQQYAHPPAYRRRIKETAEILEIGEQDDFAQDLEYILSTLHSTDSTPNVKALSATSLAKKCLNAEFRRFLRTEKKVNDVYKALVDASQNQCFALSAATAIYFLCRDPLTLRFDTAVFKLFAQLLRMETMDSTPEYDRCKTTIWGIMQDFVAKIEQVNGKKITLPFTKEMLSPSTLTLCSLSFVMAVRPFDDAIKNELVNTGILQWLVTKVDHSMELVLRDQQSEDFTYNLISLERCFGIIEIGVMMHKRNQAFLISHRGNKVLALCTTFLDSTFAKLRSWPADSPLTVSFIKCMNRVMRVLLNLSYESELCSSKLGDIQGFLQNCLEAFTYYTPKYAPDVQRFDLTVLMASLLVNMVERCNANRKKIIAMHAKFYDHETKHEGESRALEILTKHFTYYETKARAGDASIDNDLAFEEPDHPDNGEHEDSDKEGGGESREKDDNDEELEDVTVSGRLNRAKIEDLTEGEIMSAMQNIMDKASIHMEDSIVASHIALLIGCLLQQNEESVAIVRANLESGDLTPVVDQLKRFLEFMQIASATEKSTQSGGIGKELVKTRSIERIVELMDKLRSKAGKT